MAKMITGQFEQEPKDVLSKIVDVCIKETEAKYGKGCLDPKPFEDITPDEVIFSFVTEGYAIPAEDWMQGCNCTDFGTHLQITLYGANRTRSIVIEKSSVRH